MERNNPFICVIGDVGVDLVMGMLEQWPQIGTELILPRSELRAGGSAGNAVLALRHLGVPARLVSAVGNDDFGRWLSAQFHGVDARLAVCPCASTVSVGLMHSCSERNFFTTEGHLAALTLEQVLSQLPEAVPGSLALLTGVFLLPGLRAHYATLLSELRARGYQVALDTGWPSEGWTPAVRAEVRGWLSQCDHLLLNELEVCKLADVDEVAQAMPLLQTWLRPEATLVVKAGARGALACQGTQQLSQATQAADVFDTIGAGDSFNAGYLAALLQGASLAQALSSACSIATAVLSRFPRQTIKPGEFSDLLALPA
ncbi:carbohydrate kinase family protein [Paucibacter sp. TC2R-5]|uniref:carbohydrate kinase family protein n=1 Tax=Paucibacter sp. TC2R-5 TaxID=2893555 RepID=UPI0021E3BBB6|nr:carbohydrate kinase family protein [Paucibacter sp. TC2R-5]MCV2359381.1 carbohydrate kinase family protein [Paucibacter sp. TC2R-5]